MSSQQGRNPSALFAGVVVEFATFKRAMSVLNLSGKERPLPDGFFP
jgi:hypothetical protein